MSNSKFFGVPFSATVSATTSATATKAASSGVVHYVTDISGSSDTAGAMVILSSTTTLWQDIVGSGNYRKSFLVPIRGDSGVAVSVKVTGTTTCTANISGYST